MSRNVILRDKDARPLPATINSLPRQENFTFGKWLVKSKFKLKSSSCLTRKDLLHFLVEQLVQARTIILWLAGHNFVIAGDEFDHCLNLVSSNDPNIYKWDEVNQSTLNGNFYLLLLKASVRLSNITFKSVPFRRLDYIPGKQVGAGSTDLFGYDFEFSSVILWRTRTLMEKR
jgi:hypothetical protein